MPNGVSAQTAVKTLSGWSGEIRGEIAVKLVLVALPLRPRLSFEIRGFCEAQSDAHSELTPNFAAQAAAIILFSRPIASNQITELGISGVFPKNYGMLGESKVRNRSFSDEDVCCTISSSVKRARARVTNRHHPANHES
ncbi:hypothetical protein [Lapidilactobacillus salsurivasis]